MMKAILLEIEIKQGQSVKLSLGEAKELYDQLHKLFGNDTSEPIAPYVPPFEPYWPMCPGDDGTKIIPPYTITCTSDTQ